MSSVILVDLSTCGDFTSAELDSFAGHVKVAFKPHPFIKSADGGSYPYAEWESTIKSFDISQIKESDIAVGAKSGNLATAIRFGVEHPFKTLDTTKKVALLNVFQGITTMPYNRQAAGVHAETSVFKPLALAGASAGGESSASKNVIIHITNNFKITPQQAESIEKGAPVAQIVPADDKPLMLTANSDMAQMHAELYNRINSASVGAERIHVTFSGPIALAVVVGNVLSSGAYFGRVSIYDFVNNAYVKAYDI
jgi:hypothetical protein